MGSIVSVGGSFVEASSTLASDQHVHTANLHVRRDIGESHLLDEGEGINVFVQNDLLVGANIGQPRTVLTEGDEASISRGAIVGLEVGKHIGIVLVEMLFIASGGKGKVLLGRAEGHVLNPVWGEDGLIQLIEAIFIWLEAFEVMLPLVDDDGFA